MTATRKRRISCHPLTLALTSCLALAACAAAQRPSAPVAAAETDDRPAAPTPGIKPLTLEQEETISQ